MASSIILLIASVLSVTFPQEKAKLPAGVPCTYVIGSATTNEVLWVNGVEVEVHPAGTFIAMIKVHEGMNSISLVQGTNKVIRNFSVPKAPKESVPAITKTHNPYLDLGISSNATYLARPPIGTKPQKMLVMVDPGHGGNDTGALTPSGRYEKDVNLMQAKAITAALRKAGFKVVMTREDDSYPPLYSRPKRAIAEKADCFISVHHNATPVNVNPRKVRHVTTYASNTNGLMLASAIQKRLALAVSPVKDSGAQMMSLAVCRNPAVPSCLIECDFINLPEGEVDSWNLDRQSKIAEAVVKGLMDYLAGK